MKRAILLIALLMILFTSTVFASDARTLLNSAPLTPTLTNYRPCDDAVRDVLSKITNDRMSTYDKVKACYDYLIDTCSYGYPKRFAHYDFDHHGASNACNILIEHVGVCDDYSCAFAALVRAIGLNCYTVSGMTARATSGMTGHTWTVIKINNVEYVFDPQIDDNIAKGGAIGYYRFCVTYDETPGSYADYKINVHQFPPFDYYAGNETVNNGAEKEQHGTLRVYQITTVGDKVERIRIR